MENFEQSPKSERNIERDREIFFEAIQPAALQEIETDFEKQSVVSLRRELDTAKLFLLGEVHGVQENPDIIYTLFKKFGFKRLALEWNKKLQGQVEKFLSDGVLDFETIQNSLDGRITAGHFALLKKLKEEGLLESVVCFDEESSSGGWSARDAHMAKNILANLSDEKTLVVAGNLHTQVNPITFDDEDGECHPMGENIKKQIPSVPSGTITYLTGQFHNLGIREFKPKKEGVESPKARFYKTPEGVYSYELPKAHPAVVPNPGETS